MAVVLNANLLPILAASIAIKEAEAISNTQFKSERDRAAHLRDCRESYEAALALLESGDELRRDFRGNNVKDPIAHEISSYLEMGVDSALLRCRNYRIRMSYITKIRDHAHDMMMCLHTFDSADVAAAKQLAESATAFKNLMFEQREIMRSPLSQAFSTKLHQDGTTFQQLVKKYQQQNFWELRGEPFESLSDNQKIKVYARIIEASGLGTSFENLISRDLGPAGTEFLLFTAGMTVWGIFSSHCVVDAALANVIRTGAAPGGAMLREALGVADGEMPTDSALCVVMAGILTGNAGAVALGMLVSWFVETFITSGGSPEIDTTNQRYYVARTPDCVALARLISEESPEIEALLSIISYGESPEMVAVAVRINGVL